MLFIILTKILGADYLRRKMISQLFSPEIDSSLIKVVVPVENECKRKVCCNSQIEAEILCASSLRQRNHGKHQENDDDDDIII